VKAVSRIATKTASLLGLLLVSQATIACRGDEPRLSGAIPELGEAANYDADAGTNLGAVLSPDSGGDAALPCPAADPASLDDVTQLAATEDFTCALRRSGSVLCWGRNVSTYRVIGATPEAVSRPVVIDGLSNVRQVRTGQGHACALDASGNVWCWGSNLIGEAGQGAVGGTIYPPARVKSVDGASVLSDVTAIGLGQDHACAVTQGKVACWGSNVNDRLGNAVGMAAIPLPTIVGSPSLDALSVSAGRDSTCAVYKKPEGDRVAYCWGTNAYGALGIGSSDDGPFAVPQLVDRLGAHVADVTLSPLGFGCARRVGSPVSCWGNNLDKAAGNDTSVLKSPIQPAPLEFDENVRAVSSYGRNTCVVTQNGEVACIGANDAGQLGDGQALATTTGDPIFVRASAANDDPFTHAFDVAVGGSAGATGFTCAIAGSRPECGGAVYCWGTNQYGQLGNAASVDGTDASAHEVFPVRVVLPAP
jgi:alpha-tubulin suppressor-like RCC1 family protein